MKKTVIVVALMVGVSSAASASEGKDFKSWRDIFTAIAREYPYDIENTPDAVFALAAESRIEETPEDHSYALVELNLWSWSDGILNNRLRGAQSNGPFYLVKRLDKGFRLLGKMEGNRCTSPSTAESKTRAFKCSWHMSAMSTKYTRYETDGRSPLTEIETYTEEDGKRKL